MGEVIAFGKRPSPRSWSPADFRALDRLVTRLPAATGWELDAASARAFVTGAEDETLLIVSREPSGLTVTSGWARVPHWRGPSLERYGEPTVRRAHA